MEFTTLLNFRDLGGHIGVDGRRVRSGLLYRSEGLSRLTPEEQTALRDEYHICTVVDYRADEERAQQPDLLPEGIRHVALVPEAKLAEVASQTAPDGSRMRTLDMLRAGMGERFLGMAELMAEMMRAFVTLPYNREVYGQLMDLYVDGETGILQHCKGGKDRTGFGSAMILAALGVSREDIMVDYLRSNEQKATEIEELMAKIRAVEPNEAVCESMYAMLTVQPEYMQAAWDEIDTNWGGIDGFLKNGLGVTDEKRAKLQARYLED